MDDTKNETMPEIIKVENDERQKQEDKVAVVGSGRNKFSASPFYRSSGLGIFILMASMFGNELGGSSSFGMAQRMGIPEKLEPRKCALPECDIHFTPERRSEICCEKAHFIILRDMQKLKAKIHQPKKKNKRKRQKK